LPLPDKEAQEKLAESAKHPNQVQQAAALRAREEAEYQRRCEVCDKLRDIAEQTDDDALRQQAEQLDQRAWQVYLRRTKHLASSHAGLESDRGAGECKPGLRPPAPQPRRPEAGLYTIPSQPGRAAAQEEGR
jgi:hypothetical protein